MEGFIKYLKNTGWLLGTRFYGMGIGFFVTILVTRYLGPENFGTLNYAISFAGLFGFIANLGLDQVIYRDLIKHPEKEGVLLGTSIALRLVASIVSIVIIAISAAFVEDVGFIFFLILIVSGAYIFQSLNLINYVFQARVKSHIPSIASIIAITLLALAKLACVYYGKGIYYFAGIYTLEPILYGAIFLMFYKRHAGSFKAWRYDRKVAKELLIESSPLLLSSIFIGIYSRIDQVLIKQMIDVKSVGIYDAAVRLSELWYFIPAILISSLFPAIVNIRDHDRKKYAQRIFSLAGMLLGLSIVAGLVISLLSYYVILIVYGEQYVEGSKVLQLYVWSGIGVSLGTLINQYLITEKLAKITLYLSIIGMVINVALNLLLIPRYGINGSAFATLVSYIVGPLAVMLFASSRKEIKILFKNLA
jgi:O-antigen/teichoic acid export membrane protein